MARSPLYSTITRVQGMIAYVRENLSDDEFNLFLDLLVPEPMPEVKTVKRGRKKGGKSARAASLEGVIKGARKPSDGSADVAGPCSFRYPDETVCEAPYLNPIHAADGGYAGYHPFAQSAPVTKKRSSTKGAADTSTPNSETEKGAALAVAGGSNE